MKYLLTVVLSAIILIISMQYAYNRGIESVVLPTKHEVLDQAAGRYTKIFGSPKTETEHLIFVHVFYNHDLTEGVK